MAGTNPTAAGGQAPTSDSGEAPQGADSMGEMSTPQSIATPDLPAEVVGGNIIGVGSKVNQKSIIWYDKAKNYRQFEFVWDPAKEPINGGANAAVIGVSPQVPANGTNSIFSNPGGQSGFGQQPGGSNAGSGSQNQGPGPGQIGAPATPPPVTTLPTPQ